MSTLTEPTDELVIASEHFGSRRLSHKQIAVLLGISWQRVWQIEQRALDKIRRHPLLKEFRREVAAPGNELVRAAASRPCP